jgi:hypothetical protein
MSDLRSVCAILGATSSLAIVLSGCGQTAATTTTSTAPKAAASLAAVDHMLHRWIDVDDCSAASAHYLTEETGKSSPAAALRACEATSEPATDLRAGEYTIKSVQAKGAGAEATIALRHGGEWHFALVRGGAQGWQVDGLRETYKARIGQPLEYRNYYEVNGRPTRVKLEVRLQSLVAAKPDTTLVPQTSGDQRWLRGGIRVRNLSKDPLSISVDEFAAVDSAGHRYPGTAAFRPFLGDEVVSLAPRDTVTGYVGFQMPSHARISRLRFVPVANNGVPYEWDFSSR